MEHATPEALKKYLREHPKANPKNHSVAQKPGKQKAGPESKADPAANPFSVHDRKAVIGAHKADFDSISKTKVESYTSDRAKRQGTEALLASEFSKMSAPERAVLAGGHKLGEKFQRGLSKAEAKMHAHYFDRWRTAAGAYDYKGYGNPEDLELTSCKLQGLASAFGFKGSLSPEDKEADKGGEVTKARKQGAADKALLAHAKKMYDYQQAYFEHAGITELTLYRGVKFPDTDKADEGSKVQIESREMASFTQDPAVAAHFGRVIKFKVPVKNVFASSLVRPELGSETNETAHVEGCFHEAEVIVMGASDLTGEILGGQRSDDDE